MNIYRAVFFIFMTLTWGLGVCDTQTLMISEGKRLEANIALDAMNRLAVGNDRIINIFGDEGSFVSQADEQTGQVFIKPTVENALKPLSLTLITENGLTQDLTLIPTMGTASTLILKQSNASQPKNALEAPMPLTGLSESSASIQFVQLLKQAVLGELPICHKTLSRQSVPGVKTSFVKAYQSGGYLISVWSLKVTCPDQKLQEQTFYQSGDLALCLSDHFLKNGQKTWLYVLTRI